MVVNYIYILIVTLIVRHPYTVADSNDVNQEYDKDNLYSPVEIKKQIANEINTQLDKTLHESTDTLNTELERITNALLNINIETSLIRDKQTEQSRHPVDTTTRDTPTFDPRGYLESKLADMEKALQITIITKLETIENNINLKLQKTIESNKIKPTVSDLSTNKILLNLIEIVQNTNKKLDTMEAEIKELNKNTYFKNNISRDKENSAKKNITSEGNNKTTHVVTEKVSILQNPISTTVKSEYQMSQDTVHKQVEIVQNLTKVNNNVTSDVSNILNSTWCELCAVPSSVRADSDIWHRYRIPERDMLDDYMENITGCSYTAKLSVDLHIVDVIFDGTAVEQRFALRLDYHYVLMRLSILTELIVKDLPIFLFPRDKYVPFFVRIDANTVTLSTACDSRILETHNITLVRGTRVQLEFFTYTPGGWKLLSCS